MLSFVEKLAILESFPELSRNDVSLGRVNFQYEQSAYERKNVVYHLHPNGNGYVYAGLLEGYAKDAKGLVNIRDFSAAELRSLVEAAIRSLSVRHAEPVTKKAPPLQESWVGVNGAMLELKFEDELWYIFSGINLESAFETYEEAEQYLRAEGFTRRQG